MISIIIPVYNTEAYLPKCIESVRNQTLKDIEIILVDDGSKDNSGSICDAYAQKDNRIVVIHKENGGLVSARKAGLRVARGEYIGYVDSDDWVEEFMFEDMLSACQNHAADIVMCGLCFEYSGGSYQGSLCIPEGIYQKEDGSMDILYRNLIYAEDYKTEGIPHILCNKLFTRDLLAAYQFQVDEQTLIGEDAVCAYPCLLNSDRVVILNRAYYHYFMRDSSICHSPDERYFEKISIFNRQLKKLLSGYSYSPLLLEKLNRYVLERMLWGINNVFGYGMVVPTYLPPYAMLKEKGLKRIVLYGAGEVGQGYYSLLQMTQAVEVAAWVDRQWEQYKEKGLPVGPIDLIRETAYDGILIGVVLPSVAEEIRSSLQAYGVSADKIFYDTPQRIIQTLPRGNEVDAASD